jgi:ATP-dependent Clp protease protease subunit
MEIHLREVLATTRRMIEIIAHHSGKSVEQEEHYIDGDYYMTAGEAVEYGLIDGILPPRRGVSAEVLELAGRLAG